MIKSWGLNLYDKYWNDIASGIKTFEIRKNNIRYEIGDFITFTNLITTQTITRKILYINRTKEIYPETDLVVLGLNRINIYEEYRKSKEK